MPATTTITVFLAIDRHDSGDSTSRSIREARRCDMASLPASLTSGSAARGASGSWSSCVATAALLSVTNEQPA